MERMDFTGLGFGEKDPYVETVETLFINDCRNKKRIGRGIFGRAARLRAKEAVIMPSERISKFERRAIIGPGAIRITNYKEIMKLEILDRVRAGEIPSMGEIERIEDFAKSQEVIAEIRRLNNNPEIMTAWKLNHVKFTEFVLDKYKTFKCGRGVLINDAAIAGAISKTEKNRLTKKRGIGKPQLTTKEPVFYEKSSENKTVTDTAIEPVVQPKVIENETLISINKTYKADQCIKLFERLSVFLDPDEEYEIEIKIKGI